METSERKTFEKKVLPDGKPILMSLSKAPREGKPSNFQGQEKAMIGFMFRVSDNKYLELVGYPVFVRTGAWISGGDNGGRESNTHKLLEKMAGEKLPSDWDRIDARDISEESWRPFFGDYVVRMKAPQLDDDGLLKWQDVDEVINPASIEFPVEYRKAEAPGMTPGGPLGLPKANGGQTPPTVDDKPQDPPEEPPAPTIITDDQMAEVRRLMGEKLNGPAFVKSFLAKAAVERVGHLTYQQAEAFLTELRNQPPKDPGF